MAESKEVFEELGHDRFSIVFRGYDRDEVDAYIAELEELTRGASARSGALTRGELAEMLGDEIGSVLAAAEEAAQALRERAKKEADEHLAASKGEAETILRDALTQVAQARGDADKVLGDKRREAELVAERLENAARRRHDEIIREASERNKMLEQRERDLLDRIDALEKAFLSMRHTADDIYKNVVRGAVESAEAETEAESTTRSSTTHRSTTKSPATKSSPKDPAKTTDRSKVIDLTDSFDDDEAQIVDVSPTRPTKRPKRS
jgi:DivIVA domain-containing protein